VRAKRTLAEARVPLDVPAGDELTARLASVLEVIYLIFNEGYASTEGEDWMRPALCEDALRVGRTLAELLPGEPEVHGLVALMEIQSSRIRAPALPAITCCRASVRISWLGSGAAPRRARSWPGRRP
jgi:RNA polymerase sigma-70 factor (ECF subfamily)